MESGSRNSRPEQARLAIAPPADGACVPGEAAAVSSDPNVHQATPMSEVSSSRPESAPAVHSRRWAQRVWLVIFVLFCVELGLLMVVLPWTQFWTSNRITAQLPALRGVLDNTFLRGVLSGLGLVDIWIGIGEAVSYRENP